MKSDTIVAQLSLFKPSATITITTESTEVQGSPRSTNSPLWLEDETTERLLRCEFFHIDGESVIQVRGSGGCQYTRCLDCELYQECLDAASAGDWPGFTCDACSLCAKDIINK